MVSERLVQVWTDGSCDNKPDKKIGGIGIVLKHGEIVKEISDGSWSNTTSARMEILAVIVSLQLIRPGFDIVIHTDNQYVQKTVEEGWLNSWITRGILQHKKNSDLWKQFYELYQNHLKNNSTIKIKWVRGHNGNVYNEKADKLANVGRLKETNLNEE